ncbi:lectin-like domain-containing protein [Enterococcus sp. 5H]|uniref:lectin-like domain-containing protein n=1 Tax=Enterococcus sp. 5H TaxID=1229490 RepID=UPI0023040A09|nr:MucBP domain-containing protein [Enterococcus sp. 5H]
MTLICMIGLGLWSLSATQLFAKTPISLNVVEEAIRENETFHLKIEDNRTLADLDEESDTRKNVILSIPEGLNFVKAIQDDALSDENQAYFMWDETGQNLTISMNVAQTSLEVLLNAEKGGDYLVELVDEKNNLDSQEIQLSVLESKEESEEVSVQDVDYLPLDDRLSLGDSEITTHNSLIKNVFSDVELKNNSKVVVDVNNLEDYFTFSDSAKNEGRGLVTLTQNETYLAGSINLKEKLLADYPVLLTGRVNLGASSSGADGMGFGFHTSTLTSVGQTGQGMGMAGLNDAFGFKLDTHYNSSANGNTEADPSAFRRSDAFGSFVYTDSTRILRNYMGGEAPAREIPAASNNQFREFSLVYNPGVSNKILSINYNGQVWHTDITKWLPSHVEELSFLISAATGNRTNLHQIQIDRMEYVTIPDEFTFIDVDKDNFLEHFDLHGSANYNQLNGVLKLTDNLRGQAGNATLKEKISNDHPMEFVGKVNLGSNSSGADGFAIGFHQAENMDVGQNGQGMGLAGLASAFGFKLDTHYNSTASGNADRDPGEFSRANAFGAFVYTGSDRMLKNHMDSDSPGRQITAPSNNIFRDFKVSYNPGEHTKILTVEYNGAVWHRDVTSWQANRVTAFSYIMSAATGDRTNLHEVQIESFRYVAGLGKTEIQYKDVDTDEDIIDPQIIESGVGETVSLNPMNTSNDSPYNLGYDYVEVSSESEHFNPENNTIVLTDEVQTVTYYFKRVESSIDVEYIDEKGNTILETENISGLVKDIYEITPPEIADFEFLRVNPSNGLNGIFEREKKTISLVYSSTKGTVEVKYVDIDGSTLAESDILTGYIDTEYITHSKEIEGYTLTEDPHNARGIFTKEDIVVSYVYEKEERDAVLIVEFVNELDQVLPGYTITIENHLIGDEVDLTKNQGVVEQLAALESAGYEIAERPVNEAAVLLDQAEVTVCYKIQGVLSLASAPNSLDFGSLTYNATTQRVEDPDIDQPLIVTDTRAESANGWTLTASLSTPMINEDGQELINALRYVYKGHETILDSNAQTVYLNTDGSAGSFDISNSWGNQTGTDGVKLQIGSSDIVHTGSYVGVITWKVMAGQP